MKFVNALIFLVDYSLLTVLYLFLIGLNVHLHLFWRLLHFSVTSQQSGSQHCSCVVLCQS